MMSLKSLLSRHWFLLILAFFTLVSYASVLLAPEVFWPAALVSHFIPLFIIINGFVLIIMTLKKKRTAIIPLLLLIFSWPFLSSTLRYHPKRQSVNNAIRVLSFNAKLFRKQGTYSEFSTNMIQWVANDSSDIKCLQEYSTNARWPLLDVTGQIKHKGYRGYTFRAKVIDSDHNPGMAIFSKYELLNSGIVFQDTNTINGAIYADLKIRGKVVRVYNVHLASMNLELTKTSGISNNLSKIKRLKSGSLKRSSQIKTLIAHTKSSPYPYIICGDFNETPYSYAYLLLKKQFPNAFEETGNGFGFTFNEFPYLLRIDHQFYRSDIKAVEYQVDRSMNISDHFPTFGYYLMH
jgi:endonuclease/exonuclease/phosphatase family metal-dependent hydrolase